MQWLEKSESEERARAGARPRGVLAIKFGGTSVGTAARVRRAARRVRALRARGWCPVVVVSASGSTTDRILRSVETITLGAAARSEAIAREVDRALATGEDRSSALLAAALETIGVPAASVRAHEGVLRADGAHGAARLCALEPGAIGAAIAAGVVPVVSGFQGVRADGALVTLGRGSSDTTAVFVAGAVGAAECHIVTDVDAVYDADPRLTPDARRLDRLSPDELVELCESGAEVVHPEAARRARDGGTLLRVYHHRAPLDGRGTVIAGTAGSCR